jgi:ATP-dependent Clp protease adaptor protein ClpS
MAKINSERDELTVTESRDKVEKPPLYKVLLHNDNYTTMEFVVFILRTIFNKSESDAVRIMLSVHHQGLGVAGVYPREIAEMKSAKVIELARQNEFPLLSTIEEE